MPWQPRHNFHVRLVFCLSVILKVVVSGWRTGEPVSEQRGRIVRVIGPIWVSLALYSDKHKFVAATVAGVAVTMRIQQHKARLCSEPRLNLHMLFNVSPMKPLKEALLLILM